MDDVDTFMRDKFSDLGKTYLESEPGERRVLLGSICPTGLAWQYSGLSNQEFSPEYQAIRNVLTEQNTFGVTDGGRTRDIELHKLALCQLSYDHQ